MTLITKLKALESLMKEVSSDMKNESAISGPMYAHSYELVGAAVADVFVNGTSLSEEMISSGYAKSYHGGSK